MVEKMLTKNNIVGILMFVVFGAMFLWTYTLPLDSVETLFPRISLFIMMIGGLVVILEGILKGDKAPKVSSEFPLHLVIVIPIILWLYRNAFLTFGIASSSFVFLFAWWTYVLYRDCKIKKSFEKFWPGIIRVFIASASIAVALYLLFIVALQIYMPATLLL